MPQRILHRLSAVVLPVFLVLVGMSNLPSLADESVKALQDKASALALQKQYASAREVYARILERDPANSEALYRMGVLWSIDKDDTKAIEYLEKSLKVDPSRYDAWKRLGDLRIEVNRFREAAEAYGRAYQIQAGRDVREKEGVAWLSAREFARANEAFTELILQDPGDYHAIYYYGNLLLAQGEPERAARCYEAAVKLKPELVEACINLAAVRFGQQRFDEAAQLLEKSLTAVPFSAPYDPKVRFNLGLAYLKSGDPAKARDNLEKYLELCPSCPQVDQVKGLLNRIERGDGTGTGKEKK